jgi:hypothetical protein
MRSLRDAQARSRELLGRDIELRRLAAELLFAQIRGLPRSG